MNPMIRLETEVEGNAIQFDVLSAGPDICEVDALIEQISNKIGYVEGEKERLASQADYLDTTIAVASGVICGAIDSLFVGEFSLQNAHEWGSDKVESFVKKIANQQGYKGNDIKDAVKFLEVKFPIAADKATDKMGGGLQHHLRDFSHHPNIVGLFFSMLTQFTGKVYGTDTTGRFMMQDLPKSGFELIGKNFHEKIMFGMISWFFHMVSDMAGSSSSIAMGRPGTGLPGPIVSLLKIVSSLPFFKKLDGKGNREFSVRISKLFNGTLLARRDKNGKLVPVRFDLRTEIRILHELGKQSIPVIINECIVRGFYFVRRLVDELKGINSASELNKIDWQSTLPIKNPTITRMLLISSATFSAIDLADASIRSAIHSGGLPPVFLQQLVVRVNFVGIGRLSVAIGCEAKLECERNAADNVLRKFQTQMSLLKVAKVYYSLGQSWELAASAEQAIDLLSSHIRELIQHLQILMAENSQAMKSINQHAAGFIEHNKDTSKMIIDILDEV